MWVSSVREVLVPPRCRSVQRRLPCLRVEAAFSSREPGAPRTGEAIFEPSRSGDEANHELHRAEPSDEATNRSA
jgi:hypothetical protein